MRLSASSAALIALGISTALAAPLPGLSAQDVHRRSGAGHLPSLMLRDPTEVVNPRAAESNGLQNLNVRAEGEENPGPAEQSVPEEPKPKPKPKSNYKGRIPGIKETKPRKYGPVRYPNGHPGRGKGTKNKKKRKSRVEAPEVHASPPPSLPPPPPVHEEATGPPPARPPAQIPPGSASSAPAQPPLRPAPAADPSSVRKNLHHNLWGIRKQ